MAKKRKEQYFTRSQHSSNSKNTNLSEKFRMKFSHRINEARNLFYEQIFKIRLKMIPIKKT